MLEQTKEIVRKFNSVYGDTLVEPRSFFLKIRHVCVFRELTVKLK